jgi:hypothetical protein
LDARTLIIGDAQRIQSCARSTGLDLVRDGGETGFRALARIASPTPRISTLIGGLEGLVASRTMAGENGEHATAVVAVSTRTCMEILPRES